MNEVISHLLNPKHLVPRSELIGRSSVVPSASGIYAWYFSEPPSQEINLGKCWRWQDKWLLYIGISPSEPPKNGARASKNTLRKRINGHMNGNAYGSTLRLSLGCLLSETLNIKLQYRGESKSMTFADGEAILSEWLDKNAFVTWVEHDEPWVIEREAIDKLYLPLNLDMNKQHPFHPILTQSRKNARNKAKYQ